jgi:pyruvate/2-oxoacid:ferredoxin oxidoreductase alpha subunit
MEGTQRVVVAELNFGQYRQEIERLAGPRHVIGVHRVDGELITPEEILTSL